MESCSDWSLPSTASSESVIFPIAVVLPRRCKGLEVPRGRSSRQLGGPAAAAGLPGAAMLGAQGSNHGGEPQAAAANPGSSAGHTVQVRPGLYLGGAAALAEPDRLMEAGITAVLTVDSEPGFQAGAGFEGLRSLFVPALDEPETDLLSHLDRCAAFIGQSRAEGRAVLVHW